MKKINVSERGIISYLLEYTLSYFTLFSIVKLLNIVLSDLQYLVITLLLIVPVIIRMVENK